MRIVIIGQSDFAAEVLRALLENGENVIAAYALPDKPDGRTDPLKDAAVANDISVFQPTTYKAERAKGKPGNDQVFEQYKELEPNLLIMAYVTKIIPERYFEAATKGAICYHPSLLPRHRGASAINWAIIMGDSKTGLTIFWPDSGIDTGPILLQKEVEIGPDDTTGSLYFEHLFPMGVEAIVEAVTLIKEGRAPKIPQDDSQATYEPPCRGEVAAIDWHKPAQEIYDLVRGCDPQPGAYALWEGDKVRFYKASLLHEPTESEPGTVVEVDAEGLHVAVSGGTLLVGKVRPSSTGKKVSAIAFAEEQALQVGDKFGT